MCLQGVLLHILYLRLFTKSIPYIIHNITIFISILHHSHTHFTTDGSSCCKVLYAKDYVRLWCKYQ